MRKALIIGIDDYESAPLQGCVNDAIAIRDSLERHGDGTKNFDCKTIISEPLGNFVTTSVIRESLESLVEYPVEHAVLHFSGHGAIDDDGKPCLVGQDGQYLRMERLNEILSPASNAQVSVFLDCCFSGGLGPVSFLPARSALVSEGVSYLVASREDEPASELAGGGIFSSLVVGALRGGASDVRGNVTVAGLYSYVDEGLGAWDQRPSLRANLNKLDPLRRCNPLVEERVLRRLPEWFPDPDGIYELSPAHEPDAWPRDHVKGDVFSDLQKCNRARLIDPVGEDHMYYAAMNSTGCQLTPLGLRYWRMAKDGRL